MMPRGHSTRKYNWSQFELNFLRSQYLTLTNKQIADILGLNPALTRAKCHELGLKRMEMEYWTEEQKTYLLENYKSKGDKELAEIFNEKWPKKKNWTLKHIEKKRSYLGLKRTPEELVSIKQGHIDNGTYKEASKKTWATRGEAPLYYLKVWKTQYDGQYVAVKLETGYVHYARWLWEQLHGPIPEGYLIRTKDGNPLCVRPDNLMMVTKAEHAVINSKNRSAKRESKFLTEDDKQYIRDNYLNNTTRQIGDHLGVPRGTVQSFMKREKLVKPKDNIMAKRAASIRDRYRQMFCPYDEMLRQYYLTVNVNQLSIKINKSETFVKTRLRALNLVIPPEIIQERIIQSRRKPGESPTNKGKKQTEFMSKEAIERTKATRFQKGQKIHNELYDGCIRIRHDHPNRPNSKPHKYIRISKGVWKELQIYNWEKVNGQIPKGHILACIDGDTLNCEVSNWKLMTKADNARRNSIHNLPAELKEVVYLMGRVKRKTNKIKKNEYKQ